MFYKRPKKLTGHILDSQDPVLKASVRGIATRKELGALSRLAGPIVVGQLSTVGMGVVDTVMAGRLSPADLAGVAVGNALFSAIAILMIGTLLAIPPFVSQYAGAGRTPMIRRFMWQAMWTASVLAVLLFLGLRAVTAVVGWAGVADDVAPLAAGYIRAVAWGAPGFAMFLLFRYASEGIGIARPTMYFGVLGLLLNIPADYVLMYGKLGLPAMGAEGCGYATALVQWCQGCAVAVYVLRHRRYRPYALFRGFEPPRLSRMVQIVRTGLPIGVTLFTEVSLFVGAALMMGRIGTMAVASHQIAINFASLPFMVLLGTASALTVRVGGAVGRRDRDEARFRALVGIGLATVIALVSLVITLVARKPIAALYTGDAEVAALAAHLLIFCGIFQIPDALQVVFAGTLRGYKDTTVPMLLTFVAYWLVGLPLSYWLGLALGWEGPGVWWGLIGGLIVAAVLLGARVASTFRRPGQPSSSANPG